ncbi:53_t:CDS:2 [Acaulospora morrowiae]|uniref:53_t:CDS:1 n=1 Tax=Acaulospora morrowiae TaxID=94023 RepID=A0A9N9G1T3_9GLOM|nr:53_t:CDS:2 [Acaulospora morrowiae]
MQFWVNHGVLKLIAEDEWILLETAETVDSSNDFDPSEETTINFVEEQESEETSACWS